MTRQSPKFNFGFYDPKSAVKARLWRETEGVIQKSAMALNCDVDWLRGNIPLQYRTQLSLMYEHILAGRLFIRDGVFFGPSPPRTFLQLTNSFKETCYVLSETAYFAAHGKLPASKRTSRLRKKRRKIVMDWFYSGYNSG